MTAEYPTAAELVAAARALAGAKEMVDDAPDTPVIGTLMHLPEEPGLSVEQQQRVQALERARAILLGSGPRFAPVIINEHLDDLIELAEYILTGAIS